MEKRASPEEQAATTRRQAIADTVRRLLGSDPNVREEDAAALAEGLLKDLTTTDRRGFIKSAAGTTMAAATALKNLPTTLWNRVNPKNPELQLLKEMTQAISQSALSAGAKELALAETGETLLGVHLAKKYRTTRVMLCFGVPEADNDPLMEQLRKCQDRLCDEHLQIRSGTKRFEQSVDDWGQYLEFKDTALTRILERHGLDWKTLRKEDNTDFGESTEPDAPEERRQTDDVQRPQRRAQRNGEPLGKRSKPPAGPLSADSRETLEAMKRGGPEHETWHEKAWRKGLGENEREK